MAENQGLETESESDRPFPPTSRQASVCEHGSAPRDAGPRGDRDGLRGAGEDRRGGKDSGAMAPGRASHGSGAGAGC